MISSDMKAGPEIKIYKAKNTFSTWKVHLRGLSSTLENLVCMHARMGLLPPPLFQYHLHCDVARLLEESCFEVSNSTFDCCLSGLLIAEEIIDKRLKVESDDQSLSGQKYESEGQRAAALVRAVCYTVVPHTYQIQHNSAL